MIRSLFTSFVLFVTKLSACSQKLWFTMNVIKNDGAQREYLLTEISYFVFDGKTDKAVSEKID
jgi:hypothetical protein